MAVKKAKNHRQSSKNEIGNHDETSNEMAKTTITTASKKESSNDGMGRIIGAILVVVVAIVVSNSYHKKSLFQQESSSTGRVLRSPEFQELVTWIEAQGGYVHENLTLRQVGLTRGIFLDGEVLRRDEDGATFYYEVPEQCFFILPHLAKRSPDYVAPLLDNEVFQDLPSEHVQLTVAFLAELNNPASFWKSYFNTIPKAYPEQPLFWSTEQQKQLQSVAAMKQLEMSRKWLQAQYASFQKILDIYPRIFVKHNTWRDFLWAYYSISSRSFDVSRLVAPSEQVDHTTDDENDGVLEDMVHTSLLPLADLLNHAFTEDERTVEHTYSMRIQRRGPKQRILTYAGQATRKGISNSELMWKYIESNEYSGRYLYQYGMLPSHRQGDFITLRYDFYRNDNDKKDSLWQISYLGHVNAAIFGNDKDAVLQDLIPKVQMALDSLPTSLEDDQKQQESIIVSNNDETIRDLIILNVRIRFKTVLHNFLAWLQKGAPDDQNIVILSPKEAKAAYALYELNLTK